MKGWGNRQGGKGLKCKEKNDHHIQFAIQCLSNVPVQDWNGVATGDKRLESQNPH